MLDRLKLGWRAGIGVMITGIGITGTLVGFTTAYKEVPWAIWASLGFVIIASLIASFWQGHHSQISEAFIKEFSEHPYFCDYCSSDRLKEAVEMTRPYFGSSFINYNLIEQWRLKEPEGFIQITNAEGVLCSCFVILGLKESFSEEFLAGRVSEPQINSDTVLPLEQSLKMQNIYISGVVVKDPESPLGSKRTRVMIWSMLQYIRYIYGIDHERLFYAVALNKASEGLMKSLGFRLLQSSCSRTDKHNLYGLTLSEETWKRLTSLIGDHSSMCTLSWETSVEG